MSSNPKLKIPSSNHSQIPNPNALTSANLSARRLDG
jgi:hypothetical protein